MNENNQQQHTTTPTHSWGVIAEKDGGFNGEPAQHPKTKATQYIKATLAAFGPGEAITMTQDAWAKLHEAMGVLIEQPAQQQEPVALLRVFMDSVDMGQSLAPNIEFKFASASAYPAAKMLPLGDYALYTSPPAQRKPLTETEIRTLRCDLAGTLDVQYVTFARAIEAAHGIKEKT